MILGRVGSDLSDGAILCTLMADQHGYCARPKRRYRARCYPFGPSPTTGTSPSPSCHFLYHRKSADQQVKLLLTYLAGTLMSCNHVRICQYVQGPVKVSNLHFQPCTTMKSEIGIVSQLPSESNGYDLFRKATL